MEESELLARARQGDREAFGLLVEPHRGALQRLCYKMTGSQEDAEDLVQDTFVRAFAGIGAFEGRSALGTWLHRIAANAALRVVQRRREELRAELGDETSDETPFASMIAERDALQRALDVLPPEFRTALVLREYADMTYADIAQYQGVGVQTVKSRLNRARRAVQTVLQKG